MKLKLDENLPARLAAALSGLGHDVDTVVQEGLSGQHDAHVWNAAQETGRFLLTQDLDFSDIRRFQPGTHPGLLLARFHDPGREALFHRLLAVFRQETVENWRGCFVVLTEHKIRVRRPSPAI